VIIIKILLFRLGPALLFRAGTGFGVGLVEALVVHPSARVGDGYVAGGGVWGEDGFDGWVGGDVR
jgi:hypothetical protein